MSWRLLSELKTGHLLITKCLVFFPGLHHVFSGRYRSDETCPDKSGLNQRSLCLWTAQDGVVPLSPVSVAPDLA